MKLLLITIALSASIGAQSVNRTFYRDVCIQRFELGFVVQTHVRRSRFTYNDKGKSVEALLFKTANVKGVSNTDVRDFAAGKETPARFGVAMLSRDYGYREFIVDVVVKDVPLDDQPSKLLETYNIQPKERTIRCPPSRRSAETY